MSSASGGSNSTNEGSNNTNEGSNSTNEGSNNTNEDSNSTNEDSNSTNAGVIHDTKAEYLASLLDAMRRPAFSMAKFAAEAGVTKSAVRYHIERLKQSGKVRREGSSRVGKWLVF